MKTPALLAALCLLPSVLAAGEPVIGSNRTDVQAALGGPRGEAQIGQRTIFFYRRGSVELIGDRVSKVSLVPAKEYAERMARRAAEAEQEKAEAELRRARLAAAGEEIKARKLTDDAFLTAPLAYQAAFWEDFALKYPGVPCSEELAVARFRLAEETAAKRAEAERERSLVEMKTLMAIAETRSLEAEAEARAVRGYPYGSYGYHIGHYGTPFALWPIEYHFGDAFTAISPVRSPGLIPDTSGIGNQANPFPSARHTDCEKSLRHHRIRQDKLLHCPRI